mmetsp:Transcript_20325/g.44346  ORF Transcript_20325/g.44346 Transcript_20325/m.44346 type:complete len:315 (-) Transcript_20325:90-1034(-)
MAVPGMQMIADWPDLRKPEHLVVEQLLDALGISPMAAPAVMEVAKRAHMLPYPPNWSEELDAASGALYFYNSMKDESSWQHPMANTYKEILSLVESMVLSRATFGNLGLRIEQELAESQKKAAADLANWVGPVEAEDGAYYYNKNTGQSEWEDPRERHRFDLQVRYELLVGFLVAEERATAAHFGNGFGQGRGGEHEVTPTLTSMASTMSSVNSLLTNSLTPPAEGIRSQGGGSASLGEESGESYWARPRPIRRGALPLPPRIMSQSAGREMSRALYVVTPHQQRYASDVLHRDGPPEAPPAAPPPRSGSHGSS